MIEYIDGDILKSNCNIVCQQVNCRGVMGAGLAKQIREKYPNVFKEYKDMCAQHREQLLGLVQCVEVEQGKTICNLFGQNGYGRDRQYTEYEKLEGCFKYIAYRAYWSKETVAIPYGIGCGLAGGNWDIVVDMINKYFNIEGIVCKIYKFDKA